MFPVVELEAVARLTTPKSTSSRLESRRQVQVIWREVGGAAHPLPVSNANLAAVPCDRAFLGENAKGSVDVNRCKASCISNVFLRHRQRETFA